MRIVPKFRKDFELVLLRRTDVLTFDHTNVGEKGMLGIMYSPVTIQTNSVYLAPHRMAFFQDCNFFGGTEV